MRHLSMASAMLIFSLSLAAFAGLDARRATAGSNAVAPALSALGLELHRYQDATWRWQRLTGTPLTGTAGRSLADVGLTGLRATIAHWRRLAAVAQRRGQHPPHLRAWLCIHRYEGSWTDRFAPYWGGLQMSLGFQQHYGAWLYRHKGTADHWTPLEQMWTAERGLRSQGFGAWPNSARLCGLF